MRVSKMLSIGAMFLVALLAIMSLAPSIALADDEPTEQVKLIEVSGVRYATIAEAIEAGVVQDSATSVIEIHPAGENYYDYYMSYSDALLILRKTPHVTISVKEHGVLTIPIESRFFDHSLYSYDGRIIMSLYSYIALAEAIDKPAVDCWLTVQGGGKIVSVQGDDNWYGASIRQKSYYCIPLDENGPIIGCPWFNERFSSVEEAFSKDCSAEITYGTVVLNKSINIPKDCELTVFADS